MKDTAAVILASALQEALSAAEREYDAAVAAALAADVRREKAKVELERLSAAHAALTGKTPATPVASAEAPEAPRAPSAPQPKGDICMGCGAPQVFPVSRTMRGQTVTVRQCQSCGCDHF